MRRAPNTGTNQCNVTGISGGTIALDTGGGERRAVQVQSDGSAWYIIAESYN